MSVHECARVLCSRTLTCVLCAYVCSLSPILELECLLPYSLYLTHWFIVVLELHTHIHQPTVP